jgi:hypothetical protein
VIVEHPPLSPAVTSPPQGGRGTRPLRRRFSAEALSANDLLTCHVTAGPLNRGIAPVSPLPPCGGDVRAADRGGFLDKKNSHASRGALGIAPVSPLPFCGGDVRAADRGGYLGKDDLHAA